MNLKYLKKLSIFFVLILGLVIFPQTKEAKAATFAEAMANQINVMAHALRNPLLDLPPQTVGYLRQAAAMAMTNYVIAQESGALSEAVSDSIACTQRTETNPHLPEFVMNYSTIIDEKGSVKGNMLAIINDDEESGHGTHTTGVVSALEDAGCDILGSPR